METQSFIQQFFGMMGPWKWPMILLFFLVIILIIYKAYDILFNPKAKQKARGLNAILFWGSISLAAGILCQLSGMWEVFRILEQAPDISPTMVLGGFLGSFSSIIFGLITLIIAALGWFGLKSRI